MESIWSNRYNVWISLQGEFHPLNDYLIKFGRNYWYNYKTDVMVHNNILKQYLGNTKFQNKRYNAQYWIDRFHNQNKKRVDLGLIIKELEGKINELGLPVTFLKKS